MTTQILQAPEALADAEKAVLFQELLLQLANDNVTLLWNSRDSLSGADLVTHLQKARAERVALTRYKPALPATIEGLPLQAYQFEAIGFLTDRSDFKLLDTETAPRAQELFAGYAEDFAAFDFIGLEVVAVSEDDAQKDADIKCFVSVRLLGRSTLSINEVPPRELEDLLTIVSSAACRGVDGSTNVVTPEDWKLASINDSEDQAC